MAAITRRGDALKHLVPIAATALLVLILLATSIPLMHWFSSQALEGEFADRLSAWQAHGIADYDFAVEYRCACPPPANVQVRVRVRGARSTDARDPDGRAIDTASLPTTVADVFAAVREALAADHASVAVRYDDTYGFPRRLDIDPERSVDGDESALVVASFRPVSATAPPAR